MTKEQVHGAPDLEMHGEELSQDDESALYHHFEMNYTPLRHPERAPPRPTITLPRRSKASLAAI